MGRHYVVVLVLTWLFVIIVGLYGVAEPRRMAMAEQRQLSESLERGLELYARNCVQCHGPLGEGCVGMPLNRPEYRNVDPTQERTVKQFLIRTITDGRPGTGIPRWVTLPDGRMASYTAMPAWHKDKGGPLNDMHINDLANFIMKGDFTKVAGKVDELERETVEAMKKAGQDPAANPLPDGVGLTAEENRRAKDIFVRTGCVTCHRIGARGPVYPKAPDLTNLGKWGLSKDFLTEWIKNPSAKQNRMPVLWTNYGPEIDPNKKEVRYNPTFMPAVGMVLSDEERDLLARYLLAEKKLR